MSVEPRYRRVLNHSELVHEEYDEVEYTYISAGSGAGKIGTIVYKYNSSTVATVQLTYDALHRVIKQARI